MAVQYQYDHHYNYITSDNFHHHHGPGYNDILYHNHPGDDDHNHLLKHDDDPERVFNYATYGPANHTHGSDQDNGG